MSTTTINTLTTILQSLPDSVQERAVEHLREYLDDISDEIRWDESYARSSDKLSEMANSARREIREGKTEPMDFDKL